MVFFNICFFPDESVFEEATAVEKEDQRSSKFG